MVRCLFSSPRCECMEVWEHPPKWLVADRCPCPIASRGWQHGELSNPSRQMVALSQAIGGSLLGDSLLDQSKSRPWVDSTHSHPPPPPPPNPQRRPFARNRPPKPPVFGARGAWTLPGSTAWRTPASSRRRGQGARLISRRPGGPVLVSLDFCFRVGLEILERGRQSYQLRQESAPNHPCSDPVPASFFAQDWVNEARFLR